MPCTLYARFYSVRSGFIRYYPIITRACQSGPFDADLDQ